MLAAQYIHINWVKKYRTPQGAVARKPFYEPHDLADDIDLKEAGKGSGKGSGKDAGKEVGKEVGAFLNEINLLQWSDEIMTYPDYYRKYLREDSYHKRWIQLAEIEKRNKGIFLPDATKLDIPSIEVKEQDGVYIVYWYSMGDGYHLPIREGHNANFLNKESKAYGQRNKCVEAFRLAKGEAGMITFNYRTRWASGGFSYSQSRVYLVHTDELSKDVFTKASYEKEFEEMADLL